MESPVRRVPFIGLTGGLGAGKSEALRALAELGAMTLSTDEVAHEVLASEREAVVERLRPVLADPAVLKIAHNGKYDLGILSKHGLALEPIDDTMLISYALDGASHGHGMDELAKRVLDYETVPFESVCGRGQGQQRAALAEWSATLERRVAEEVAQVERLSRLKRFFSPRLAARLVGDAGDAAWRSHRAEVTVLFADLRGFSAFAEHAPVEQVAAMLADFHAAMGALIFAADGTLDAEWEARNVAFHEALYEACGSPSLKLVCHLLYERHSRYRRLRTRQGDPSRNVSKEHEGLMRATIGRQADAAIALLRKHRSATMADVTAGWPARDAAGPPSSASPSSTRRPTSAATVVRDTCSRAARSIRESGPSSRT